MNSLPALVVGEVLFDHFPDGSRVLGGAPFNVAWNLQGFGLAPTFVSAVGDDSEGREIRDGMESWGMTTIGLQTVYDRPTGAVRVEINAGQPSYSILPNQAYDEIRPPSFPATAECFGLLYVGSLALRQETSRRTIQRLIVNSNLPRFVDVNIRQPWFDRGCIPELLDGADWIKLNDDELAWITELECTTPDSVSQAVVRLQGRFGPSNYFITCGSKGAYSVDQTGAMVFQAATVPDPMVDTVGAGDAFAAATIMGLQLGKPVRQILRNAVAFASRVCAVQGATQNDPSFYTKFQS